jgi:hypothetical protein
MTLIVAKHIREVTIVVSDTKLSPHSNASWRWSDQANKIVCVSKDWAVGFAGNTYVVDAALKSLPQNPRFDDLKTVLLDAHQQSLSFDDPTDFLLLSVRTQAIHRIASGQIKKQEGGTAWIGETKGYSIFQGQYHARLAAEATPHEGGISFEPGTRGVQPQIVSADVDRLHTHASNSLRGAIEDSATASVGGVPLTFVIAKGNQTFWPNASGLFTSPAPVIHASRNRDILFGEAQTGDFNYEVMVSEDSLKNVVAVYYRNARTMLIFARWEGGIPFGKVFSDVDYADAASFASEQCGASIWRVKIEQASSNVYTVDADGPSIWRS